MPATVPALSLESERLEVLVRGAKPRVSPVPFRFALYTLVSLISFKFWGGWEAEGLTCTRFPQMLGLACMIGQMDCPIP